MVYVFGGEFDEIDWNLCNLNENHYSVIVGKIYRTGDCEQYYRMTINGKTLYVLSLSNKETNSFALFLELTQDTSIEFEYDYQSW